MKKKKVQVSVFYFDQEGYQLFLLLKTNRKRGHFWQNITGGVEDNEGFKEAALREFSEETGLNQNEIKSLKDLDFGFEFKDSWGHDCIEKSFVIELKRKEEIKLDPSEHVEYKWLSYSQLDRSIVKYESNFEVLKKSIQR